MLALRLDTELEARLGEAARRSGRTKSWLARRALQAYIDDLEDHALIEEALNAPGAGQKISHSQMKRELGLDA